MKKRVISIILSIMIVFGVVVSDYQTVMAIDIPTAFWGTLEASRAFFTALYAGGALDHGISLSDFIASNQREWMELAPRVLEAYQAFCFYKEKIVVSAEHPDWNMSDIDREAMSRAFVLKNRFNENAITVSGNTTGQITAKDWGYWKEFCGEFAKVAHGGNIGSSTIGPNTVVYPKVYYPTEDYKLSAENSKSSIGSDTFVYDGDNYICKFDWDSNGTNNNIDNIELGGVLSDRVRIPFLKITAWGGPCLNVVSFVDVNILTKQIIGIFESNYRNSFTLYSEQPMYNIINNTQLPVICEISSNADNNVNSYINEHGFEIFAVSTGGEPSQALDWQYAAENALNSNKAGESIKNGTKENSVPLVRDNSIPIKRSSLKEEEKDGQKVVSGVIGWDIPETKVIEGTIADPRTEEDYKRATGVIDVPIDDVIDYPEDVEVVVPDDADIVIPDNPDLPIPIAKLLEIQYGPFYPVAMDITEFFPFCIPFDIAYCINKFNVGEGTAPVLHIPIKYPNKLKATLGDSYDVVIDFNDYIALRNIIRYFILLLFIVGLMTITRNLIRG